MYPANEAIKLKVNFTHYLLLIIVDETWLEFARKRNTDACETI
jgi:hypothetical protein